MDVTEGIYFHSAGNNFSVVRCRECLTPMHSIYDPKVRDECYECSMEWLEVPRRRGKIETLYGIQR